MDQQLWVVTISTTRGDVPVEWRLSNARDNGQIGDAQHHTSERAAIVAALSYAVEQRLQVTSIVPRAKEIWILLTAPNH